MAIDYKNLIIDVIQFEKDFVGKNIALSQIKSVDGLEVDNEGNLLNLDETKAEPVIKELIARYSTLLGSVAVSMLAPTFQKYGYQLQGGTANDR